jgi:hypothetical protein
MLHRQEYYSELSSIDCHRAFCRSLCVCACVVVFSITAFGQCDWGANTYSDIWVWGENLATVDSNGNMSYDSSEPAGRFHVAASGTIDAPYNSCGHEYSVASTTLASPSGRTSQGSDYADLDLFDPYDQGDYSTESFYETFCPIANNSYSAGSSSLNIPVGVSFTCFNFVRVIAHAIDSEGVYDIGLYNITSPCNASCKANTLTYKTYYPTILPTAISSAEPYAGISPYVICSHLAALLALPEGAVCSGCADIGVP